MDNEELFLMLEECVEHASTQLIEGSTLESFAMILKHNNETEHVHVTQTQGEERYEALLEELRHAAKTQNINAFALLSNVTIPDNFNPTTTTGIRIHIEEKEPSRSPKKESENDSSINIHKKLSARLLYVPYQLFKTASDDTIQIQLHDPIPVGLACEVFK